MEQANYYQTIPNSHSWTDLNQLLEGLKYPEYVGFSFDYLRIGIENTIKNGYNLTKVK